MKLSIALKSLLATAAVALPLVASAASTYSTGSGTLTAAATVNFSVVIPHFLYLRIGTGLPIYDRSTLRRQYHGSGDLHRGPRRGGQRHGCGRHRRRPNRRRRDRRDPRQWRQRHAHCRAPAP